MAAPAKEVKGDMKEWQTSAPSWWCPGCGDFGVLAALQRALANLGLKNEETVIVTGIGCSGKLSGYVRAYGYHSLHGRALPPAQAIKLANKGLNVIVAGGDGDGYGIGAGHFLHAMRRNVNITYLVMDNLIYGLTKGQASPTSELGFITGTSPEGTIEAPIRPLALAMAAGATFVSQAFSGDMKHLMGTIEAGIQHEGFSLINTFSPCVTFNKKNTYQWFRDVLVKADDGSEIQHDPRDRAKALELIYSNDVYYGVLYEEDRPTLEGQLKGLQGPPLSSLDIARGFDYRPIVDSFRS